MTRKGLIVALLAMCLTACGARDEAAAPSGMPAAAEAPATTAAALGPDETALALANRSGCLACHAVERRVIGPAWRDVAARYRGQDVRDRLINKVKLGGQGNWTEVTGGIPMPPNSPRVKDADIEKLVDFILALPG